MCPSSPRRSSMCARPRSRATRPTLPSMSMDDPAVVQAGTLAFAERGCMNCHGGPGVKWAKFSEGLHPSPPDLKEVVVLPEPGQLFGSSRTGLI